MAVTFEGMERRMPKIEKCLAEYGIANLEEARKICNDLGFDPYDIVKGVQPIAFENAGWAYTLGCAVAVKKGAKTASEAAEAIGIGLEAFCIPGSVAEQRNVGRGLVTSAQCSSEMKQSALHSSQVTKALQQQRVLSVSLVTLTKQEKSRSVLSLTVLARTLLTLFQESTALHM